MIPLVAKRLPDFGPKACAIASWNRILAGREQRVVE
jgi:hypothetical protein